MIAERAVHGVVRIVALVSIGRMNSRKLFQDILNVDAFDLQPALSQDVVDQSLTLLQRGVYSVKAKLLGITRVVGEYNLARPSFVCFTCPWT